MQKRYQAGAWILIIIALIMIQFSSCSSAGREYRNEIEYTVLFFNDIHGTLFPYSEDEDGQVNQYGGITYISRLVKDIRTENGKTGKKTFLLFGGDILQGSLMSTIFKGYPDVLCFNEMGVDVMVIGNHEFDYTIPNFMLLMQTAKFPFISSNIMYDGRLMCKPFVKLELSDDLYITVIGTTIKDIFDVADKRLLEGITTTDSVESIRKYIDEFSQEGPIIVLSHNELDTEKKIAETYNSIDALITGHDHILIDPCLQLNNVCIFQAYQKGKYLGRLEMAYYPDDGESLIKDYRYYKITPELKEDENVSRIINGYKEQLDAQFSDPIGRTETFLEGERQKIRCSETNLGNFIADSVRGFFNTDIVFINSGSVRSSINKGTISLGDIYNSLTFDNDIYILELTGKEIMEVLEKSFGINYNYGGFLIQSGLKIELEEREIKKVQVINAGEELLPDKSYKVAVNSFIANGGDHYSILASKGKEKQYISLRDLVIDTIMAKKTINPSTDGRILYK